MELHCTTGLWPPQPAQLPLFLGECQWHRLAHGANMPQETKVQHKARLPRPLQEGVRGWSNAEPGGLALSQAASDHGTAHLPLQRGPCQDPGRGCKVPEPRES